MDQVKGVMWWGRVCDLKMVIATQWIFDATVTWTKTEKDLIMHLLYF
jgi:hypothetical protein